MVGSQQMRHLTDCTVISGAVEERGLVWPGHARSSIVKTTSSTELVRIVGVDDIDKIVE